jgi:hypothetical protein
MAFAGLTTGVAYLNGKFHISKDLGQLRKERQGQQNLAQAGTSRDLETVLQLIKNR